MEIIFVIGLLLFAVVSFLRERRPPDQIALTVLAALLLAGSLPLDLKLPSVLELLQVFSSPAPMTIAGMFVLGAALENVGIIEKLASSLGKLASLGYRTFLFVLVLFVAVISAFVNNTPVVMIFMPVILSLSRTLNVPASKLLIPLSYASIFGGTCTLVGTSTNLLASDLLTASGYPPISMFELGKVGLPLVLIGAVYLTLFSGRLLPERQSLTAILSDEERKEFITEAFVQEDSPLVGRTIAEARELQKNKLRLTEVIRDDVAIPVEPQTVLLEGDRLVLACRPSGFVEARNIEGLALKAMRGVGLEALSSHEGAIVEGIIGPRSSVVGQTIAEINFRQRFRVLLLAIHRRGENLRGRIEDVRLEEGDLLLMMGTDSAIRQLRGNPDVFLLDRAHVPSRSMRRKAPIVLAVVGGGVTLAALGLMPIVAAVLIGVAIAFGTGCVEPKDGYANVEWGILVLIYGMLGLGLAMQTSGTADLLAGMVVAVADLPFLSEAIRPYVIVGVVYLTTMVMTETVSNNATVVLMTPIALSLGASLGMDPRPFVIATCIAASASFSTPIGYQTNTYVYGVGGYRFTDFLRVGLPLNLIYFVVSVLLIPRLWG